MNKIFVLGADGQVGKELRKNTNKNFVYFNKKNLNITDRDKILKKIKYYKPKIIVNLAAYIDVILKLYKIKLIHISTDYVFDGKKKLYKERDIKNPLNFYGMTKSLAEDYIIKNLKNYSIIRSSWIYSNQKNSFIKKILNKIKKKKQIYGVIDTYSGPTSTKNLSKAIDFIIKNNIQKKILHYCDGNRISPYDFILKIINISNIKKYKLKKVKHRNLTLLATRPKDSYLGISKELKNVKSLSFDEQIKSYVR